MDLRRLGSLAIVALVGFTFGGCKKTDSPPAQNENAIQPGTAQSPKGQSVSRLHWLGRKRLAAETNATSLISVLNLPESAKLETQTLDKLSLAPWRLLKSDNATNGAPVALLRPLLDDVVQEESCVEIRQAADQTSEFAFAIRLSAERAGLWQTNLAAVMESLTGLHAVSLPGDQRGWSLKKHDAPNLIELKRTGEWTLVGLAQNKNTSLAEFVAQIESTHAPFPPSPTNSWLTADLDLRALSLALSLGWKLPDNFPRTTFTLVGDGKDVQIRGELTYAQPLLIELEPWNIPTNLIHDPLTSFVAVRSARPLLEAIPWWSRLKLGSPPNQLYLWAHSSVPFQTYFAAPMRDGSNRVHQITTRLVSEGNLWLATNGIGTIVESTNFNGFTWNGLLIMSPWLHSFNDSSGGWVEGGFYSKVQTNPPPPPELLAQIRGNKNLLCYDWEITQARIEDWLYIGQLLRIALNQSQVPPESPGIKWLVAAKSKLGNCGTAITVTDSNRLAFTRRSGIGLTGVELHLLVDWLESPKFPAGLHTYLSPPDTFLRTNMARTGAALTNYARTNTASGAQGKK